MTDVSLSVYLQVLGVGAVALVALTRLQPMREWWGALRSTPAYFLPTLATWTLLLWPKPVTEAFAAGNDVGALRIARIAVFLGIFAFTARRLFILWHGAPRSALRHYARYVAVCVASTAYSPLPAETIWKAFELVVAVMCAAVWLVGATRRGDGGRHLLHALLYLLVAVVVFSLVGVVLHPGIAYTLHSAEGELAKASAAGIVPRVNPNNLGQLSGMVFAMGVLVAVDRSRAARRGGIVIAVVGLATLIAAHSRTSLVAAALILAVLLLVRRRYVLALLLTPVAAAVALSVGDRLAEFFARGQDLDAITSMTGRLFMWAIAWSSFLETPWLGKGFYAGHKTLPMQGILENYSSVDNTYLEALVNVGLVGTTFLVAFAIVLGIAALAMARSVRRPGDGWRRWEQDASFVLVGFVLIRAFTGPTFQVLHVNVTIMTTCAVILSLWRDRARQRAPAALPWPPAQLGPADRAAPASNPREPSRMGVI